jgi:hypothetical protein
MVMKAVTGGKNISTHCHYLADFKETNLCMKSLVVIQRQCKICNKLPLAFIRANEATNHVTCTGKTYWLT